MTTSINAATELEARYKIKAESDRDLRKLQQAIDQSQIRINELWDRARLEVELVRAAEANARKQLFAREKWLRAAIAHDLRHELGIPAIPGYESPLDKLRNQRRSAKRKAKLKTHATTPHTS